MVSLGALVGFSNEIRRVYCEKILQVAYLDQSNVGRMNILWNDLDPDEKFCEAATNIDFDADRARWGDRLF